MSPWPRSRTGPWAWRRVLERIGPRFARAEPRTRAGVYVRGLLSQAERKNGWTLAEQAGDATPDAMQRLLNHADWDADAVRDDLRDYVVEPVNLPGRERVRVLQRRRGDHEIGRAHV